MGNKRETLPGGTVVLTGPEHRFGTDALLLAGFAAPKPAWAAADLCAGCGIVLWALWDAGLRGPALAVEIDPAGVGLIEEAIGQNGAKNVEVHCGDLRTLRPPRLFDLVTANPPYFSEGPLPPQKGRALARHEVACTLEEVCAAAAGLLKDGGRFCLCYPPQRLAELFAALGQNRLEPKRLCFVRKSAEAAPWLVLVDARKNGGKGLSVLPERILPLGEPIRY